jgi:hypothetical protein
VDLTEIARLMEANLLQVFNERDPARRREVIARIYAADVRWTDDDGTVTSIGSGAAADVRSDVSNPAELELCSARGLDRPRSRFRGVS